MNMEIGSEIGQQVREVRSDRPYRYADPRALSEAWYEALYGLRPTNAAPSSPGIAAQRLSGDAAPQASVKASTRAQAEDPELSDRRPTAASARDGARRIASGARDERTRDRTNPRAQQTASVAAQRAQTHATLKLPDGSHVRMLLQECDGSLGVTVVADAAHAAELSAASERVRAALAMRGIRATIDIHDEEQSQ